MLGGLRWWFRSYFSGKRKNNKGAEILMKNYHHLIFHFWVTPMFKSIIAFSACWWLFRYQRVNWKKNVESTCVEPSFVENSSSEEWEFFRLDKGSDYSSEKLDGWKLKITHLKRKVIWIIHLHNFGFKNVNFPLAGALKYVLCSSLFGEMIQFDEHMFEMGGEKPPTSQGYRNRRCEFTMGKIGSNFLKQLVSLSVS